MRQSRWCFSWSSKCPLQEWQMKDKLSGKKGPRLLPVLTGQLGSVWRFEEKMLFWPCHARTRSTTLWQYWGGVMWCFRSTGVFSAGVLIFFWEKGLHIWQCSDVIPYSLLCTQKSWGTMWDAGDWTRFECVQCKHVLPAVQYNSGPQPLHFFIAGSLAGTVFTPGSVLRDHSW